MLYRKISLALGLAAAALLAVRAWIGPFRIWGIGVRVGSPFTLETLFLMALVALVLLGRDSGEGVQWQVPRWGFGIVLIFIAVCFAGNLRDPFLSDDYIVASRTAFNPHLILASFHQPGGDGAFRPVSWLYVETGGIWAGTNPARWHLLSLALHLINCWMVYLLVGRLWAQRNLALVAAILFGVHGSRPEVVTWMSGESDLLAVGFVLAAILAATRARLAAVVLLTALGILCKESAYATPFFMLGFLLPTRGWRDRGVRYSIPGSSAVCLALFVYRWVLFHGPGGYIDPATGRPMILSMHFATVAKALGVRIWDVLLFPVNWDAPMTALVGVAIALGGAGLLWSARGANRRVMLALTATTVVVVLPAIHLAAIGESMLGSRILYLPSIPFVVLMAKLIFRRPAGAAAVILASVLILEHNLSAWHRVALMAREACASGAPDAKMPGTRDGVYFFQNGFTECRALSRP